MIINLSPQRRDDKLIIRKQGDILTVNGDEYDFSVIPEGASLPASAVDCQFIIGDIHRKGGDIEITFILPHDADASDERRYPQPIVMTGNGDVKLPV